MSPTSLLSVPESYAQAEAMARRRLPHLYRVARLFPDRDRYRAFCATYASMRWVDDRVDEQKSALPELAAWEAGIDENAAGRGGRSSYGPALADTLSRFDFPLDPWRHLATAMRYDLENDGFPHYQSFLDYAEGATVAPASIFATLLLMRRNGDSYRPARPYAEIRDAVRQSAISCYEVHILRDAREDLADGRNYFPEDELKTFGLVGKRHLDDSWRGYLRAYGMRTRGGWSRSLADMESIEPLMTPRERLMLHLLVEFYSDSLKKIARLDYDVWSNRHWPTADDITGLLERLAARFEPGVDLSELAVKVVEDV